MKVNIENVRQFDSFFDLHEQTMLIDGINYGVVYVLSKNMEWNQAIEQAITKIQESASYEFFNMNYTVNILKANNWPRESFLKEKNIVTPLFTPDRYSHYYLSGVVTRKEELESIMSFMIMEAHQISEKCSEAAFVNLGNWDSGNSFDEESDSDSYFNFKELSFRGRNRNTPNPTSFLKNADEKSIKPTLTYAERIQKLRQLPTIVTQIRSKNKKEGETAFANIWNALTEREKGHLCFELFKRSRKKDVADIVGATVDREEMGRNSRFTLIIKESEGEEDIKNFNSDYMLCTYLKDAKGKLTPLMFSKTTQVLYTLSIINKKQKPQDTPQISILENKDAFISIYAKMFGKYEKKGNIYNPEIEAEWDKLFPHMTSTNNIHYGNLNERYNEIENGLVKIFRTQNIEEDPLPYFIKENIPLAISSDKIELPPYLEEIAIK